MKTNFKDIEKKLNADNWRLVRVAGSHHIYKKPFVTELAVLPNHGNRDISIGVLKNLERITGLDLR